MKTARVIGAKVVEIGIRPDIRCNIVLCYKYTYTHKRSKMTEMFIKIIYQVKTFEIA